MYKLSDYISSVVVEMYLIQITSLSCVWLSDVNSTSGLHLRVCLDWELCISRLKNLQCRLVVYGAFQIEPAFCWLQLQNGNHEMGTAGSKSLAKPLAVWLQMKGCWRLPKRCNMSMYLKGLQIFVLVNALRMPSYYSKTPSNTALSSTDLEVTLFRLDLKIFEQHWFFELHCFYIWQEASKELIFDVREYFIKEKVGIKVLSSDGLYKMKL